MHSLFIISLLHCLIVYVHSFLSLVSILKFYGGFVKRERTERKKEKKIKFSVFDVLVCVDRL